MKSTNEIYNVVDINSLANEIQECVSYGASQSDLIQLLEHKLIQPIIDHHLDIITDDIGDIKTIYNRINAGLIRRMNKWKR